MTQSVAALHMVAHKKHNAILLEAAKTFIGPDTQIGMPPATLTPTWLDNYDSQDGSQKCLTRNWEVPAYVTKFWQQLEEGTICCFFAI